MVINLHNHKGSPRKDVVTSIWTLPVWAGWPKLCLPSTAVLAGLLKRAGSAPLSYEGCQVARLSLTQVAQRKLEL